MQPLTSAPICSFLLVGLCSFMLSMNIVLGDPSEQLLITGTHKIAEVRCKSCDTYLGWKYIRFYFPNQSTERPTFNVGCD